MSDRPARPRPEGPRRVVFEVPEEDAGLRLDQVIALRVPELSRRKARLAIELGGVFVDRSRTKMLGRRVRPGESVEVSLGGALERASGALGSAARTRDAALLPRYEVVHEDEDLVVVEKPAGLLTAPTPESDRNNLADLLARRTRPPRRVWVVHRLDLETSGLLVFAKSPSANRALAELFRVHDVEREYLAVVEGAFPESVHAIDAKVAGRAALSRVTVVRTAGPNTLLRVRLETGRTHQVRLHLAGVGHPVCGDRRYGRRGAHEPPRLALHATRLAFAHPRTGESIAFDSPWPEDLRVWLDGSRAHRPGAPASGPTGGIC